MSLRGRTDVRLVELYGRKRTLVEFRDVDRAEAVRLVRSVMGVPPRPSRWVQPAAQVKIGGKWRYVGPQTAELMGVFPKQEVV